MNFKISSWLCWTPRGLSLMMVLGWFFLLVHSFSSYLGVGVLVALVLFLNSLIAWKSAAIGGSLFIILGSGYLLFAMGQLFSFQYVLAVIPFYLTGSLFLIDHLYVEKRENRKEDDFQC